MNILEEIIAHKKIEVDNAKDKLPLDKLKKSIAQKEIKKCDFTNALQIKIKRHEPALIAEIKKASPSQGIIKKDFNHLKIAKSYKNGGAICLSILTDKKYFLGDLNFIQEIKKHIDLPILRKDFIIDPYQIYESIYYGADCILLIVRALPVTLLRDLYEIACENEIDSLIEVHDEREMEIALNLAGEDNYPEGEDNYPRLLGINNRDLKTFQTNLNTTKNLVKKYKRDLEGKIVISESGIFTRDDVKFLMEYGVYGFLVGEGLIINDDIEKATRELIT